jgi:hypothetical protein
VDRRWDLVVRVHGAIDVRCPVEVAFDAVADERNAYDPSVIHAEKLTPGPIGVGTRFRSVVQGRRAPVETTVTIVDHDRPHRLRTTTSATHVEIVSQMTFSTVPNGTRIRWSCDIRTPGALLLLRPLLRRVAKRQTTAVWRALKDQLERASHPVGRSIEDARR